MANSFNGNPCNNCECQDGDIFGDNTLSVDGLAQVTKNEGCSHTVHVEPLIFVDSATVDFSESVSGNVQTVTANANVCAGLDALDSDVKAVGDEYIAINGGVCKKVALDELIAVYTDDTIDGAGTEGDPLSVNACEVLATLPDTGIFDVNDRIVVYDFVDGECKTVDSVPADLPSDLDGGPILASDNIVRSIKFEDGTPLDTDGNGSQILELDCSLQKDGSQQIGVSSNYVKLMPFVALATYNVSGVTPAVDAILTSPISAPLVISNPCSDRDMEFMPFIEANTAANNSALNTGYCWEARTFYRVNGGAWLSAGLVTFEQHVPAGATLGAGSNSWSGESTRALDRPTFIIPAGGSVTIEGQCFFEVLMKLNNGPLQFGINVRLSGTGRLI